MPTPPAPHLRPCSMGWEAGPGAATLLEALVCPPSTLSGYCQAQGATPRLVAEASCGEQGQLLFSQPLAHLMLG